MSGEDWPSVQKLVEQAPVANRWTRSFWPTNRDEPFPPGVYVIAFHSVYDERTAQPWERLYDRVLTRADDFEAQLSFLRDRMEPVGLGDIPALFDTGVDAPYFAVTFDDGYVSIAGRVAETCDRLGVNPTAFVCGDFASGRTVYYRVPLLLLEAQGHRERVAQVLSERHEQRFGTADLMSETKARYRRGVTDDAVLDVWCEIHGDELPRVHLTYAELQTLEAAGWSIGNHTRSHPTLAGLAAAELDDEVLGNEDDLRRGGLSPLPWLAYPNGGSWHVDAGVGSWMEHHPGLYGAFGNGGVNFEPSRSEWLRIPVSDEGLAKFRNRLRASLQASHWALRARTAAAPALGRSR